MHSRKGSWEAIHWKSRERCVQLRGPLARRNTAKNQNAARANCNGWFAGGLLLRGATLSFQALLFREPSLPVGSVGTLIAMNPIENDRQNPAAEDCRAKHQQNVRVFTTLDSQHPPPVGRFPELIRRIVVQLQKIGRLIVRPTAGISAFVIRIAPDHTFVTAVVVHEQVIVAAATTNVVLGPHPIADQGMPPRAGLRPVILSADFTAEWKASPVPC